MLATDAGALSWIIVALYAAAAVLCWRSGRVAATNPAVQSSGDARRLWLLLLGAMLLLGFNKQLDLQTIVQRAGKNLIEVQGWYEHRRSIKIAVASILAIGAGSIVLALLLSTRKAWRTSMLGLLGIVLLAGFFVLRAAAFQRMDEVVRFPLAVFDFSWVLEVAGIACIAIAAWRYSHATMASGSTRKSPRLPG
jgi:Na+-transporting NADH:ubiquinone oxidoreductase subunit NqrB